MFSVSVSDSISTNICISVTFSVSVNVSVSDRVSVGASGREVIDVAIRVVLWSLLCLLRLIL